MKTKLYIVRHAETIGNIEKRLTGRKDYELTEKGLASTEKLAKRLSNIKFDVMYSSTSNRTAKTIEPLAKLNNLKIIQLDDLCEMYFGDYDGWKWEDVNKLNPQIKQRQNEINEISGIPNQESMEDASKREYDCIKRICEKNAGKNILICSHGVVIEGFLRQITGISFNDEREKYCQHNVALNILTYENGKFEIDLLADTSFLKDNFLYKKSCPTMEDR